MEKVIKKIVVTGGPCGGKTTGICKIPGILEPLGWKTIIIPEAATETIIAGVTPNHMSPKQFQAGIVSNQLFKERLFEYYANQFECDKILLICDRGLMDNRAYCNDDEFDYALAESGLDRITARDSYDAVFHMVTAANGAEEFYTCANNAARKEGIEEARALDKKAKEVWCGHPYFRVIDNSDKRFDVKIKRLIDEICLYLGEPVPMRVERSFLIKKPDISVLQELHAVPVSIFQTYLRSEDGIERRVRQRGSNDSYLYFYTEKRGKSKLNRVETERRISAKEYIQLLSQSDTSMKPISKTRYYFEWNAVYYKCDIYPYWGDKAIIEVEMMTEEQEIHFPESIQIIEEVTLNPAYSNYSIAEGWI